MERGKQGAWDWDAVLPVAPVVHDDKIWIYYGGRNMFYASDNFVRVERGWVENGQRMQEATGLATLRLDGFVSLDGGAQTGTLTTRLLEAPGGSLIVNADVRGELRVELLDENDQVIPGYSAKDCVALQSDGLRQTVGWANQANIDAFRGRAVKLRFSLRNGSLYAFTFE
jgi:hypothetical protein